MPKWGIFPRNSGPLASYSCTSMSTSIGECNAMQRTTSCMIAFEQALWQGITYRAKHELVLANRTKKQEKCLSINFFLYHLNYNCKVGPAIDFLNHL